MTKLAFVVFMCLWLNMSLNAQSLFVEHVPKGTFKAIPNTDTWRSFSTHDQMLEATSLNPAKLKELSTESLVTICLNYPLYMDVFAYNNPQEGLERQIETFNGLEELISRPDAGKELLKVYATVDPTQLDSIDDLETKGTFTFQSVYIEFLLSHPSVVTRLSSQERKLLLELTLKNYWGSKEYSDVYSQINLNSMALVMERTMRCDHFGERTNEATTLACKGNLMKGTAVLSEEETDEIALQAEELLAQMN